MLLAGESCVFLVCEGGEGKRVYRIGACVLGPKKKKYTKTPIQRDTAIVDGRPPSFPTLVHATRHTDGLIQPGSVSRGGEERKKGGVGARARRRGRKRKTAKVRAIFFLLRESMGRVVRDGGLCFRGLCGAIPEDCALNALGKTADE